MCEYCTSVLCVENCFLLPVYNCTIYDQLMSMLISKVTELQTLRDINLDNSWHFFILGFNIHFVPIYVLKNLNKIWVTNYTSILSYNNIKSLDLVMMSVYLSYHVHCVYFQPCQTYSQIFEEASTGGNRINASTLSAVCPQLLLKIHSVDCCHDNNVVPEHAEKPHIGQGKTISWEGWMAVAF